MILGREESITRTHIILYSILEQFYEHTLFQNALCDKLFLLKTPFVRLGAWFKHGKSEGSNLFKQVSAFLHVCADGKGVFKILYNGNI